MQFNRLRRREFITLLGGAAVWASAARGQLPAKLPIIGFLGAASPSVGGQWFAAFVQKLRDLGWVEGRNIAIEARWAEGRGDRAAQIAAEFVRLNVDLIVTWSTESALAAKRATSAIPIVFALSTDPVGSGLVASLARPGGNATGFSVQTIDIAGKRLGLLREIVPKLGRLALLANVSVTDTAMEMREIQKIARQLGIDVVATLEIRQREDITPAFETLKVQPDALFVVGDPLTFTNRSQINTLALGARLPTMYSIREFVAAGGLMSYGTNFPDLFRRSAEFSDKILRGAKPADIPVEQPTKFDLVINRTTAKALGLTVPDTLLALADEIIE
jgi:putative ABC transport system substrate-binding protein